MAAGIVPDCGPNGECTFEHLVELANNLIQFMFKFGAIIAGLLIAYAGWLYLTSGGNPGNVSKAKGIFWKVLVGFVIMLGAYLVVTLILRVLGYEGSTFIDV